MRQTLQVSLPPDLVWSYLSDLSRRPEWDFSLRGVDIKQPLSVGTEGVFRKMHGSSRKVQVNGWAENQRLVLTEEATVGSIQWEYQLIPKDGGTEVTALLTASSSVRLLGVARLEKTLKESMENLKRRLEDPSDQLPLHPFTLDGFPMVHRAMRKDLSRLDGLLRRIQLGEGVDVDVVRAWFAFVWAIAEGHHMGEDAEVFPRVAARSLEFRKAWGLIETEHAQIDRMVKELDQRLQKGVEGMEVEETLAHLHQTRDFLEGHLVREEVAFERAIRADWSPEEQLSLQNVLRQAIPMKLIELVIPWMLDSATEEERKKVLSQLPLPARILYRASWQSHYHTLLSPFSVLPAG